MIKYLQFKLSYEKNKTSPLDDKINQKISKIKSTRDKKRREHKSKQKSETREIIMRHAQEDCHKYPFHEE